MTDDSPPPLSDSLRERLLKTLRLAQQGVGGERDNAEAILDKLLKKHGLTRAALEEIDQPVQETFWYNVQVADRKIFAALARRLFTRQRAVWKWKGNSHKRGLDLSAAERVTFELAWEVYKKAWHRVREDVETAFIRKHKLFDPTGPVHYVDDLSEEERAAFERQQALARSLESVAAPGTKRIKAGGQ